MRLDAFFDGSGGDGLGYGPVQSLDEPGVAAEPDFLGAGIDAVYEFVRQPERYLLHDGMVSDLTSDIRSDIILGMANTDQDVTKPVPNADPRFTIRRHLEGHAYPCNGNTHNPNPLYRWYLLVDGCVVDSGATRAELVQAARESGAAYLAEIDTRVGESRHAN